MVFTSRSPAVYRLLLLFSFLLHLVYAQHVPHVPPEPSLIAGYNDTGFPADPYLRFRPPFAHSLPVQILATGVVLALCCVLLINIMFTAQYHWPLAPVNFALQLSSVLTLLVSLIATLHVILQSALDESGNWPYMLSYISVGIPPLQAVDEAEWSTGELAAWSLMNAVTSGLIQVTHIQFLTLLFPSKLERRLILSLLGPLAITSAIMQLLVVVRDSRVVTVVDVVTNVCNATLSLLFTASLFIYGFLVNRRSAWRTDGGTAAFGAGALTLALISTALTFAYIPTKGHYVWMPTLMWAIILWQSFLGWWWWVGAGMGAGDVEELIKREAKRDRRRKRRLEKRKMQKEKATKLWKGVAETFRGRHPHEHKQTHDAAVASGVGVEPWRASGQGVAVRRHSTHPSADNHSTAVSASGSGGSSSSCSVSFATRWPWLRSPASWLASVRRAHISAAREQAVENVERINQAYGREFAERPPATDSGHPPALGWGLGSFGVREMERREGEEAAYGDREALVERDVTEPEPHTSIEMVERWPVQGKKREEGEREEGRSAKDKDRASMWWWGPLRRWRLQDSTSY